MQVESARATGAQEQMRAAEDLREIPPEDRPQDVLGCHSCYERGRAKTSTSVMITRRFQYRSVSAHRSLACGSRVSQAGWAVAAEHLGLFEVDRMTRGGVHPDARVPRATRPFSFTNCNSLGAATGRDRRATLLGSTSPTPSVLAVARPRERRRAEARASSRSIRVLRVIDIVSAGPPSACPTALSLHPCA
jgi:hypothetical protein